MFQSHGRDSLDRDPGDAELPEVAAEAASQAKVDPEGQEFPAKWVMALEFTKKALGELRGERHPYADPAELFTTLLNSLFHQDPGDQRGGDRVAAMPLLALATKWRVLASKTKVDGERQAYISAANELDEWVKTGFLTLDS